MWTQESRARYNRDHLRYPSDLTEEEWAVVAPLMLPPRATAAHRARAKSAIRCGCERGVATELHPKARRPMGIDIGGIHSTSSGSMSAALWSEEENP